MVVEKHPCSKRTNKTDWGFWKKKQQTLVIGKYDNPLYLLLSNFLDVFVFVFFTRNTSLHKSGVFPLNFRRVFPPLNLAVVFSCFLSELFCTSHSVVFRHTNSQEVSLRGVHRPLLKMQRDCNL